MPPYLARKAPSCLLSNRRLGFALPLVLWLLSFALGILALLWGLEVLALQQARQERRRALGEAEARALVLRRLATLETQLAADGGGVGLQDGSWVWRGGSGAVQILGAADFLQQLQQSFRLRNTGAHQLRQIDGDFAAVVACQQLAGQADIEQFLCHGDGVTQLRPGRAL